MACIFFMMHALLPDTALAKSDGIAHWRNIFIASLTVLGGAFSFGLGVLSFWLLTCCLVLRSKRFSVPTALANAVFPIVVILAALRGQQIQGARYLVWTLFFSIAWNILELSRPPELSVDKRSYVYTSVFIAIVFLVLPFEAKVMYGVLRGRTKTVRQFQSQHLDILSGKKAIAADVGYIGFFSEANVCDLAGLVNGREHARRGESARAQTCASTNPDFLFLNSSQLQLLSRFMEVSAWQVCGHAYDFVNVRSADSHYLLLPNSSAGSLCREISNSYPLPISAILPK
jgi:hypothetical protein